MEKELMIKYMEGSLDALQSVRNEERDDTFIQGYSQGIIAFMRYAEILSEEEYIKYNDIARGK